MPCGHPSVHSGSHTDVSSVLAGLGLATVPLVFSYIEMLRQAGPQRWVFDELAAVAEQRFRFADEEEASEYVSRLAASLPLYAPEHALNGPHVHEAWRPGLVRSRMHYSPLSTSVNEMSPPNVRPAVCCEDLLCCGIHSDVKIQHATVCMRN